MMQDNSLAESQKSSTPSLRRVLSPHLGIYRWEITMVVSILHRATGLFLWGCAMVGLLLAANQLLFHVVMVDLAALASNKYLALVVTLPVVFSLFFHGANGVRHFFWDMGLGYNIHVARGMAWVVMAVAVAATVFSLAMIVFQ